MSKLVQYPTKLFLAGVVAVALLALGSTSILAPAWAKEVKVEKTCDEGNTLACIEDKLDLLLQIEPKIVFASSVPHDGNFGGVVGADAFCNGLAASAGLTGPFFAWIASSVANDPYSRFTRAPGPYVRTDGVLVANDWKDLIDGSLSADINVDENEGRVSDFVWTSVKGDATYGSHFGVFDDCNGWTSSSSSFKGFTGFSEAGAGDGSWTSSQSIVDGFPCDETVHHIYCFEQ